MELYIYILLLLEHFDAVAQAPGQKWKDTEFQSSLGHQTSWVTWGQSLCLSPRKEAMVKVSEKHYQENCRRLSGILQELDIIKQKKLLYEYMQNIYLVPNLNEQEEKLQEMFKPTLLSMQIEMCYLRFIRSPNHTFYEFCQIFLKWLSETLQNGFCFVVLLEFGREIKQMF